VPGECGEVRLRGITLECVADREAERGGHGNAAVEREVPPRPCRRLCRMIVRSVPRGAWSGSRGRPRRCRAGSQPWRMNRCLDAPASTTLRPPGRPLQKTSTTPRQAPSGSGAPGRSRLHPFSRSGTAVEVGFTLGFRDDASVSRQPSTSAGWLRTTKRPDARSSRTRSREHVPPSEVDECARCPDTSPRRRFDARTSIALHCQENRQRAIYWLAHSGTRLNGVRTASETEREAHWKES
jgi:hypothetical protein